MGPQQHGPGYCLSPKADLVLVSERCFYIIIYVLCIFVFVDFTEEHLLLSLVTLLAQRPVIAAVRHVSRMSNYLNKCC